MPVLYVVATPIGNLEDITRRALRVLGEVTLILAEDTRTTRKLLARYGLRGRLLSYHEHNRDQRVPQALTALSQGDVALVSEAGTPGISDPGRHLVQAATAAGFPVVPVPGPSVVTAALAVSGLPAERYLFLGFLPRRASQRRRLLAAVATEPGSLLLFEAPHRLHRALSDLLQALGDRRAVVCRELTKLHEEVFRGTLGEALAHFTEPKGEFTLVVEGASAPEPPAAPPPPAVEALVAELRQRGAGAREAVAELRARFGLRRRQAYDAWLRGQPPARC